MLTTIRAEIDAQGQVHLLEEIEFSGPRRALVTILDDETTPPDEVRAGNVAELLALMRTPFFAHRPSYSAADIEATIEENRNAWE